MSKKMRTESDSMGEVKLPVEALYGATTKRAIENFKISGRPFPPLFIQMLGELKSAAALANKSLGLLDAKLADAIVKAATKVAKGECQEHFPLDVFQTGSGTSTNMNANEVIANLANLSLGSTLGSKKPVHPNDHVNKGQSSNDAIPTVIHLAALVGITKNLFPALRRLEKALSQKAKAFDTIVKIGRTHLMDATPIRLGQEFSGYAHQVTESVERLERSLISLCELAIGGTAVGTGINTHPEFAKKVCEVLSKKLGLEVREARNHFAAQAAKDACVEVSGALKATAVALIKIADDIRWFGSGPRAGLAEIILPELQPGSSIMPGKTNPVIPEVVCQVAAQVIGNDAAITWGGGLAKFELNTMMPLITVNLLDSIELMTNASNAFVDKCISGIEVNKKRCEELVEQSLMLSTPLVPHIGYDRAAKLAKKAAKQGKTIRQVALEEKVLSPKELDRVLNVRTMTEPTDLIKEEVTKKLSNKIVITATMKTHGG